MKNPQPDGIIVSSDEKEVLSMFSNIRIADMAVGDDFEGFYVLKTAVSKVSSNNKPFLSATLADATGEIDAKAWDYAGPVGAADEGQIIKLRGTVSEYRGTLQVTVDRIRLAEPGDPYDLADLVPVAPMDSEAAFRELEGYVNNIDDPDYRAVCRRLVLDHAQALRSIPAAKSVHHSFLGGLLMHTLNMLKTADFLAGLYADTVDRSLLLCGVCLHDLGKEQEFLFSSLGLVTDYSVKGELLGHLVMGAQEVARVAQELNIPEEKSVLLQHLLLSHHGEPEFGAAVRPLCAEAELLSLIDKIDSRMEVYRENLPTVNEGEFTQRIFALEKKIYRHK